MDNLVAESGGNKGQLSYLVEAICHDFLQHDEAEPKKLVEWQKTVGWFASYQSSSSLPTIPFLRASSTLSITALEYACVMTRALAQVRFWASFSTKG